MNPSFHKIQGAFFIRIEGRFESAHYLYAYFPDGTNEPIHGHSWLVELFIASKDDGCSDNGISFDFLDLQKEFEECLKNIDHCLINELSEFKGVNPTAENIARWFYNKLHKVASGKKGQIKEIRVHEGPAAFASFIPYL